MKGIYLQEVISQLYNAVAVALAYIYKVDKGEDIEKPEIEVPDELIFDENGNRKLLTGEPSQVAEDIYNLAEIGVSYLTLDYKGTDIDETLYKMERFTKLVKALL